ncbi:MAG: MobA/MobL family protein [Sphingobium sp.]
MDGQRTERRLLAAERTVNKTQHLVATLRRMHEQAGARAYAAADSAVARELGPAFGRTIRVRVRVPGKENTAHKDTEHIAHKLNRTGRRSVTRLATRAYKVALKDGRGRVALFFRIRYVGLKSRNWRPGLAADHVGYILREAAQENDEASIEQVPLSNMGKDADEISAAWRALEAIEEGYRSNAKVQYRIIWNLPHNLTGEQRRELVSNFCERTFSRLGLPWVAALHNPDDRGDQRNYHAHVCFSTRPCEHVGHYQWDFAPEKVNGLTDKQDLKRVRALAAAHMNTAWRAAGLDLRFTHETYQERGLDAERQEHVGAARMAAHDRGEAVAMIERNAQVVERNEAAAEIKAAAKGFEATSRLVGLMERQIHIAAERRRMAKNAAAVRAIAERARALADKIRPVRTSVSRDFIMTIIRRARTAQALLSAHVETQHLENVGRQVSHIAMLARSIAERQRESERRHMSLSSAKTSLVAADALMTRRAAEAAIETRERATDIVMNAASPPYLRDGGRVVMDLSAMREEERAIVLSVDQDTRRLLLAQRIEQDRERRRDDEARRERAAQQEAAAHAQRERVAQGCRLLLETPVRPYRLEGKIVVPDLSALNEMERTMMSGLDFRIPDLQQALIERVKRDRTDDRTERLFQAVATERHILRQSEDRFAVSPAVLKRFDLQLADIVGDAAQQRLARIALAQQQEVRTLKAYVSKHPNSLKRNGHGHSADDNAPPEIRAIVEAWSTHPILQPLLAVEVDASAHQHREPKEVTERESGTVAGAGALWLRARKLRDAAAQNSHWFARSGEAAEDTPGTALMKGSVDHPPSNPQTPSRLRPAVTRDVGIGE